MKNKRVDIIDEALNIVYLEKASSFDDQQIDKEIAKIDSVPVTHTMGAEKENKLLSRLTHLLTTQSLGQVVKERLVESKLTREQLAAATHLPLEVINDLIADSIYTNNVPIVLFKNLLAHLQIKFSMIEQSIRKTFDLLESRVSVKEGRALHPAYRKGFHVSRDTGLASNKSDGKELYENAEALDKYLARLKELVN